MDSWKLRDELFQALGRWVLILAFMLAGGLLGFAISYLAPAPYLAVKDIYLGLDISRVNEMEYLIPLAAEEPLNLDDYKNWQLKQVADILTSDQVLGATLDQLRGNDPSWAEISLQEFRKAVDIYWYEAGTWRMEVVLADRDQAAAAVESWVETGHQRVAELLKISQDGFDLDQEIWTFNLALADQKRQKAKLETFISSAGEWMTELDSKQSQDPIDSSDYDRLTGWLTVYEGENAFWQDLLSTVPDQTQPTEIFRQWLAAVLGECQLAREEIVKQLDYLQVEKDLILPAYHQYLTDSLGLSANIILLPNTSGTQVHQVFSTGRATLGGTFLGFLAWIIFVFIQIRPGRKDHAQ